MNFGFNDNKEKVEVYELEELENLLSLKAPLESPSFTGTPTAPTPATGTNNTQIATTAFMRALFDLLMPVGTVIGLMTNSPRPAYGTWARYDSRTYYVMEIGFYPDPDSPTIFYYYLWKRTA